MCNPLIYFILVVSCDVLEVFSKDLCTLDEVRNVELLVSRVCTIVRSSHWQHCCLLESVMKPRHKPTADIYFETLVECECNWYTTTLLSELFY